MYDCTCISTKRCKPTIQRGKTIRKQLFHSGTPWLRLGSAGGPAPRAARAFWVARRPPPPPPSPRISPCSAGGPFSCSRLKIITTGSAARCTEIWGFLRDSEDRLGENLSSIPQRITDGAALWVGSAPKTTRLVKLISIGAWKKRAEIATGRRRRRERGITRE